MFKWASTASPTLLVWTRSFEITARHWNVPWAGWQVGKLRLLTKEAFRLPSFFTVSERVAVEAIIVKVETNRAFVWVCLHRAAECCRRREGVGRGGEDVEGHSVCKEDGRWYSLHRPPCLIRGTSYSKVEPFSRILLWPFSLSLHSPSLWWCFHLPLQRRHWTGIASWKIRKSFYPYYYGLL